jgi:putative DNA primase/helicase
MTRQPTAGGTAEKAAGVVVDVTPESDVQAGMDVGKSGRPIGSLRNSVYALTHDSRWSGRLRWSRFEQIVVFDGRPLRDTDLSRIAIWLDDVYDLRGAADALHRAVNLVSEDHSFHPVCDWLNGLVWDGQPRLDHLLVTYLRAVDTPLHRKFSAGWLIGACARAFEPGCQLDTMLVLIGRQGAGKSQACEALVPVRSWFGDTGFDIGNKDAFMNLHGKWIYELPEGESLRNASDEATKAFITSRVDRYRAPFARLAEDHPRQVAFVATGNIDEVLRDPTGGRRYWPVRVGEPDLAGLRRDRVQLFAEAVARYQRGEIWHLDGEYPALLIEAQRDFEVAEAWEAALAPWVARQTGPFTVEDAMGDGLHLRIDQLDGKRRQRAGRALARLGCTKTRPRAAGARRVWCWVPPGHLDLPESGVCEAHNDAV